MFDLLENDVLLSLLLQTLVNLPRYGGELLLRLHLIPLQLVVIHHLLNVLRDPLSYLPRLDHPLVLLPLLRGRLLLTLVGLLSPLHRVHLFLLPFGHRGILLFVAF